MSAVDLARRLLALPPRGRESFAQCGEDLIMAFIGTALGLRRPSYFDLGAHHPVAGSNTYHFYRRGSRGVCVEPEPALAALHRRHRPRDICLRAGVSATASEPAPFYVLGASTLSTFDRATAEAYCAHGRQQLVGTVLVPRLPINALFAAHGCPDLLSLDVEGLDLEILAAWDAATWQPRICCIETLTYSEERDERKRTDIIELMRGKGYLAYADTYINTVFVLASAWRAR